MSHLTDTQLQSLADGTLRGPEGLGAREHCEGCAECGSELSIYTALNGQLSTLRDPLPPSDFTATVLAAVRVPLGIGAFLFFAVVLTALSRTLRPVYARLTAGS